MAEPTPMELLNEARFFAFKCAQEAAEYLYATMRDPEEDSDRRIMAAAELLAFAKVP